MPKQIIFRPEYIEALVAIELESNYKNRKKIAFDLLDLANEHKVNDDLWMALAVGIRLAMDSAEQIAKKI